MIHFSADIRQAQACSDDAITTSSVGIPVELNLASDFNGLSKTVVFRNGSASADVALVGDATETTVPVNVLGTTGQLHIGIYAADGNGTIVIPTVWALAGIVKQGVVPSGVDPSAPTPSWVAQVQSIASQASEEASDALTIAQGVKAQADAGNFDGTDGVSPTVSVSDITGGHRVVITDANGSHTFDVMDGVDGTDGTDGTDGYSPTVSITDITGGHRVTITDVNGSHSFDVMDGQGGGGAVSSVNGQTGDVVLDADDVGALPDDTTAADLGAYVKPSGGIPKADLASAVQTSLGKADSALQSYTETDPTVPSWAKQQSKPSYTKSEVGLGNVDNVQQYSATNPPPYPVSSVNGQTGAVSLSIPSSASDVGAEPAVTEVTVSTAGAVTQALDAGKIYHFTGALTALTVTATDPTVGKYQFDFISGSTAPTLIVPSSWVMPNNFMVEPSARYSLTVENGYCSLKKWSDSHSPFIYLDSTARDFTMNTSGLTSDSKVYANVGSEVVAVSIGGKLKNQLANNTWLKICDISANAKALMGSTYVSSYVAVGSGKVAQCAFNTWETSSEIRVKNNTGAALAADTQLVGTIFILRTL